MNEEGIRSNATLLSLIEGIKARASDDSEAAYMLGLFFKFKYDSNDLTPEIKKHLVEAIKLNKLTDEYYLHKPVEDKQLSFFAIVFFIAGLILIIGGLIKMLTGRLWILENLRYLQTTVDDGRYAILAGLLIGIPCSIAISNSRKKSNLIRKLKNQK